MKNTKVLSLHVAKWFLGSFKFLITGFQKNVKRMTRINYTTLHYTTLHYTTQHYTTIQYNIMQYNTTGKIIVHYGSVYFRL